MNGDMDWPLGRSGDKTLVALRCDAELLAPLLAGVPEPEDFSSIVSVLLSIASLEVEPERVAEELANGPDDVWLVLSDSDASVQFWGDLENAMVGRGQTPPQPVFLPLTVRALIDALPSGLDVQHGTPSRHARLIRALTLCAVASAPHDCLASILLWEAKADVGFSASLQNG